MLSYILITNKETKLLRVAPRAPRNSYMYGSFACEIFPIAVCGLAALKTRSKIRKKMFSPSEGNLTVYIIWHPFKSFTIISIIRNNDNPCKKGESKFHRFTHFTRQCRQGWDFFLGSSNSFSNNNKKKLSQIAGKFWSVKRYIFPLSTGLNWFLIVGLKTHGISHKTWKQKN